MFGLHWRIPMDNTISLLSRTLAQANRFLILLMQEAGLCNLVTSHGDILMQLFQQDGLAMRDLARRVDRDPSTVTALVKKLAAQGYVTTARARTDRRAVVVSLTEQGRELHGRFLEISDRLRDAQDAGISIDDLATTQAVLERIQQNFRTAAEAIKPCRADSNENKPTQ